MLAKKIVSINGELHLPENAKISVFDRGFLFGDSVYEVTIYNRKHGLFLKEHLERLRLSASKIYMNIPFSDDEISHEIMKVVEKINSRKTYIRIIITRGTGEVGLETEENAKVNLVIIGKEQSENPKWWYEKGVQLIIPGILRNQKESLDPNIKSGNYLNNVLAMIEAKRLNAYDAVMLNSNGHVTEGTTNNIWMVKNNTYYTPPLRAGILKGITRTKLIELTQKYKLSFIEDNISAEFFKTADEIFLTSSTKDIVPVTMLDGQKVGDGLPGKLTLKLLELYRKEFIFVDETSL